MSSTGNTFINFFENCPWVDSFHCISLRKGPLEPNFFESALFFNDINIIKSALKNKHTGVGVRYDREACSCTQSSEGQMSSSLYKYNNSTVVRYIGIFVRDFFWKFGTWKSDVKKFINDVHPDVIFFATSGMKYHHNILHYIHSFSNAKIILFHADDHLTLKCFSLNPLFWMHRLHSRKLLKKTASISDLNFCITRLQCKEYSQILHVPCQLLTKGRDFSNSMPLSKVTTRQPLQLVFTGNILFGRWRTLGYIGQLLDELKKDHLFANLFIYTGNDLHPKAAALFNSVSSIQFMGSVPNSHIQNIQENADVLIHAETFRYLEKFIVRQSFSTKIVDYLHSGRCILAAGASGIAPIQYFSENDTGLVLTGKKSHDLNVLRKMFDENIRNDYARKAWDYGKNNHDHTVIKQTLFDAFTQVMQS